MRVIAAASIGISIPIRSQLLASGHHKDTTRRGVTGAESSVKVRAHGCAGMLPRRVFGDTPNVCVRRGLYPAIRTSCSARLVDAKGVERFAITIDESGLVAQLQVMPGPAVTAADLHAWLAAQGVVFGLDEAAVAAVAARLSDPDYLDAVVVANGTEPVCGDDGELRGGLIAGPVAGKVRDAQKIDFRERSMLPPVKKGEPVAEIVKPTAGTKGCDVRGHEVAAAAGDAHGYEFGSGVTVEGRHVVAAREGVVLVADDFVDVVQLYTHDGDVDYESGNLHTEGSFVINGSICTGFRVTASGDVIVAGDVQLGAVTAGGSVHVSQAILGCEDVVRAGADITCHHTAASRLLADRSIAVSDQVHESTLQAPRIDVLGGRGTVRGARLKARDKIHVGSAGSPAGTETVLAVAQLLEERNDHARRALKSARLDRTAGRSGKAKDVRAASKALDAERAELVRLRRRQRELMATARIRVDGTCHEGVIIRFGAAELRPETELQAVTFRWDPEASEIQIGEQT